VTLTPWFRPSPFIGTLTLQSVGDGASACRSLCGSRAANMLLVCSVQSLVISVAKFSCDSSASRPYTGLNLRGFMARSSPACERTLPRGRFTKGAQRTAKERANVMFRNNGGRRPRGRVGPWPLRRRPGSRRRIAACSRSSVSSGVSKRRPSPGSSLTAAGGGSARAPGLRSPACGRDAQPKHLSVYTPLANAPNLFLSTTPEPVPQRRCYRGRL